MKWYVCFTCNSLLERVRDGKCEFCGEAEGLVALNERERKLVNMMENEINRKLENFCNELNEILDNKGYILGVQLRSAVLRLLKDYENSVPAFKKMLESWNIY